MVDMVDGDIEAVRIRKKQQGHGVGAPRNCECNWGRWFRKRAAREERDEKGMLVVMIHDGSLSCLLLCWWLTVFRRMLGPGHLHHIADDSLQHRTDTSDEKNEAKPEVPRLRCEHVAHRSESDCARAYLR